jgi:hypothetical protein
MDDVSEPFLEALSGLEASLGTVEWPGIATVTQTKAPISSAPNMTWTPTLDLTESGVQC